MRPSACGEHRRVSTTGASRTGAICGSPNMEPSLPPLDPSHPLAMDCRCGSSSEPAHPRRGAWPGTARWDAWIPPSHSPPLRLLAGPHAWQVTHDMDGGVVRNRLLRAAPGPSNGTPVSKRTASPSPFLIRTPPLSQTESDERGIHHLDSQPRPPQRLEAGSPARRAGGAAPTGGGCCRYRARRPPTPTRISVSAERTFQLVLTFRPAQAARCKGQRSRCGRARSLKGRRNRGIPVRSNWRNRRHAHRWARDSRHRGRRGATSRHRRHRVAAQVAQPLGRKADASGPGLTRPQPLRSHRQPGNRPARPFQGSTPEKLARSMRCFGRAPISHYRHQRWLVALWRAVKLYLLPVKTLPKSAFAAVDWHYEPSASDGTRGGSSLLRRIRVAFAASPTREPIPPATVSAGGRVAVQELACGRHSVGAGHLLDTRVVGAVPRCGRRHSLLAEAEPQVGSPCGALTRPRSTHPSCTGAGKKTSPTAQCGSSCRHRRIARRLQLGGRRPSASISRHGQQIEAALTADCRDIDNEDYVKRLGRAVESQSDAR